MTISTASQPAAEPTPASSLADLLPPFVPSSDTLWTLLTDGYDWSYIANLPDGHPDRPLLIARAARVWAKIRAEAGCC